MKRFKVFATAGAMTIVFALITFAGCDMIQGPDTSARTLDPGPGQPEITGTWQAEFPDGDDTWYEVFNIDRGSLSYSLMDSRGTDLGYNYTANEVSIKYNTDNTSGIIIFRYVHAPTIDNEHDGWYDAVYFQNLRVDADGKIRAQIANAVNLSDTIPPVYEGPAEVATETEAQSKFTWGNISHLVYWPIVQDTTKQ